MFRWIVFSIGFSWKTKMCRLSLAVSFIPKPRWPTLTGRRPSRQYFDWVTRNFCWMPSKGVISRVSILIWPILGRQKHLSFTSRWKPIRTGYVSIRWLVRCDCDVYCRLTPCWNELATRKQSQYVFSRVTLHRPDRNRCDKRRSPVRRFESSQWYSHLSRSLLRNHSGCSFRNSTDAEELTGWTLSMWVCIAVRTNPKRSLRSLVDNLDQSVRPSTRIYCREAWWTKYVEHSSGNEVESRFARLTSQCRCGRCLCNIRISPEILRAVPLRRSHSIQWYWRRFVELLWMFPLKGKEEKKAIISVR